MSSKANINHTDSENQEFTLLNSSTQYRQKLQRIQNSYDENARNQASDSHVNLNQFNLLTEEYPTFSESSEIITLDIKSGTQKINKLILILSEAGIQVQGIRLNSDDTAIELGFQNADLKYKAILIMESIGL